MEETEGRGAQCLHVGSVGKCISCLLAWWMTALLPFLLANRASAGQARATMQVGIRIVAPGAPVRTAKTTRRAEPAGITRVGSIRSAKGARSARGARSATRLARARGTARSARLSRTVRKASGGRCFLRRQNGGVRRWFCFVPGQFRW